jgi:hypothetical protein
MLRTALNGITNPSTISGSTPLRHLKKRAGYTAVPCRRQVPHGLKWIGVEPPTYSRRVPASATHLKPERSFWVSRA